MHRDRKGSNPNANQSINQSSRKLHKLRENVTGIKLRRNSNDHLVQTQTGPRLNDS